MSDPIVMCGQCRNYEQNQVGNNGECSEWNNHIKHGTPQDQNEYFYRHELGGDGYYINCDFLADEPRECKRFAGKYAFVVGD